MGGRFSLFGFSCAYLTTAWKVWRAGAAAHVQNNREQSEYDKCCNNLAFSVDSMSGCSASHEHDQQHGSEFGELRNERRDRTEEFSQPYRKVESGWVMPIP